MNLPVSLDLWHLMPEDWDVAYERSQPVQPEFDEVYDESN